MANNYNVTDTKEFVMQDAQNYANTITAPVNVLVRGNKYQATVRMPRGWKLVEVVQPEAKNISK